MQERQVTIGDETLPAARAVPRAGDAEPDRAGGHLSAARGAGRPLHAEAPGRLSRRARRSGRSSTAWRRRASHRPVDAGRRPPRDILARARARRPDLRRRQGQGLHRRPRLRDARARRRFGLDLAPLIEYGASPRATLCLTLAAQGARVPPGPRLRHAAGREDDRARRAAPPRARHLRGRGRGGRRRRRRRGGSSTTSPSRERRRRAMLTREQLKTVRKIQIRTGRLVTRPLRRPVPERVQGPRHGVRRGAPVPARRRRAHDRLERHRAHRRAAREALRRGARADRDAAGRRQRLARTSAACGRPSASSPPSSARCSRSPRSGTTTRSAWSSSPTASSWRVPPRKGTRHVLRVIREVLSFAAAGRGTDIARGARAPRAASRKRRCVVFVISDFLDPRCRQALRLAPAPARRDRRRARRPARGDAARTSAWSSSRRRRRGDALRRRHRRARACARRSRARAAAARTERDRMLRACRRRRHRRRAPIGPTPRRCCASSACGSAGSEPRGALAAARGRARRAAAWRAADEPAAPVTVHGARRARPADDRPALPLRHRGGGAAGRRGRRGAAGRAPRRLRRSSISASTRRRSATARPSSTRWWRLVGWSPGEHAIESPPVHYRVPGRRASATPRRDDAAGRRRERARRRQRAATDIRDIKPARRRCRSICRPWYVARRRAGARCSRSSLGWRWLRAAPARPGGRAAAAAGARGRRSRRCARCAPAGSPSRARSRSSTRRSRASCGATWRTASGVRAPEMTTEEFLAATARGATPRARAACAARRLPRPSPTW